MSGFPKTHTESLTNHMQSTPSQESEARAPYQSSKTSTRVHTRGQHDAQHGRSPGVHGTRNIASRGWDHLAPVRRRIEHTNTYEDNEGMTAFTCDSVSSAAVVAAHSAMDPGGFGRELVDSSQQ